MKAEVQDGNAAGTVAEAHAAPPRIEGYRITRKLAQGATSEVFLALRTRDSLPLVLKVLLHPLRRDRDCLVRFIREGNILAKLSGPYVGRVFDQGLTIDRAYLALEHFPGGHLAQRIEDRMPKYEALRCLVEIACALEYVHGTGVVHRSLKPRNVMFRADGSLALVDFGSAKELTDPVSLARDEAPGALRYISPEGVRGEAIDHRHDLYSLGVIFYEMLTGQPLHDGEPAVAQGPKHEPVPRLSRPLAPCQGVLDRLLAEDRDRRYQSAAELLSDARARFVQELTATDPAFRPGMQSGPHHARTRA